jgi:malate dehydrogenase (decarboxylating)
MLTALAHRQARRATAWGVRTLATTGPPDSPPTDVYDPQDWQGTAVARGRGMDVLHDPVFNKGTGHPLVERERLGLRGLLPARVLSMEAQVRRVMERYQSGHDYLTVDEEADSGVTHERLRRWHVLQEVQVRVTTV